RKGTSTVLNRRPASESRGRYQRPAIFRGPRPSSDTPVELRFNRVGPTFPIHQFGRFPASLARARPSPASWTAVRRPGRRGTRRDLPGHRHDPTSFLDHGRWDLSMISVVIAAHNEARVIGGCLDALLADAGPDDLDIVVVANGCTDDTAAVAARRPEVR